MIDGMGHLGLVQVEGAWCQRLARRSPKPKVRVRIPVPLPYLAVDVLGTE